VIDFENAPGSGGGPFGGQRDELPAPQPVRPPFEVGADPSELPSFLAGLNDPQREAALTVEGPLIVLAGAGSGKTKMLTSRVAYLVGYCGVRPYNVLAVTFTNKAAKEMRDRVERALEQSTQPIFGQPEIGTFHSVCVRLLRREMDKLPFTKPFVIYDDADQRSLVKKILSQLNYDTKKFNPKAIQGFINGLKNDALEPDEVEPNPHSPFEKVACKVYEVYQKALLANNALDFGEIICMTYRLLRDHDQVRRKYQLRYQFIHVDEYQDTNRAQYLLLSTLSSKKFGGHENICVVGDEDQSIYGWRGADINNILDFDREYLSAKMVKLEQNYRSTKNIIEAASAVIANNTERKNKQLWTANDEGLKVQHVHLGDERAEAEFVVGEIKARHQTQGIELDQFAVFYRTHAQSRQFEDVLRREKMAYQVVGGLRFYDRKEVKDMMAYLRLILNPDDSVSLLRVINVPKRGIGKSTLEKLDEILLRKGEGTLWDVVRDQAHGKGFDLSPRVAKKLSSFVNMMEDLMSKQPDLMLSELYYNLLDATGYVGELRTEGTVESLARIENLEELDTIIQEFEEEVILGYHKERGEEAPEVVDPAVVARELKQALLGSFLERATLSTDTEKEVDLSCVKLMSLHAAKGLEFPVCFLTGLEEGLFPSHRPWEETDEAEIEEERRLCYVGMTRAEQVLYCTGVASRRIWGEFHFQDPARFLSEIPANLVEYRNLARKPETSSSGYGRRSSSVIPTSTNDDDVPVYSMDTGEPSLVGMKIRHQQYGPGSVIRVDGSGDDAKVMIKFATVGTRKFLLKYVKKLLD